MTSRSGKKQRPWLAPALLVASVLAGVTGYLLPLTGSSEGDDLLTPFGDAQSAVADHALADEPNSDASHPTDGPEREASAALPADGAADMNEEGSGMELAAHGSGEGSGGGTEEGGAVALFTEDAQGRRTLLLDSVEDVDHLSLTRGDPLAPECVSDSLVVDAARATLFDALVSFRGGVLPMAWRDEKALGDHIHTVLVEDPDGPYYERVVEDEQMQAYVESLLQMLSAYREGRTTEYELTLIRDRTPNAFATIGGRIYVHTGLLRGPEAFNSEAQLVALLAHEMAHLDRRHTALVGDLLMGEGWDMSDDGLIEDSMLLNRLMTLAYSPSLEDEADRYAYERLIALGYSPFEMERWFWEDHRRVLVASRDFERSSARAAPIELFPTHRSSGARACNIRAWTHADPPPERTYRGAENLESLTPAYERLY